MDPLFYNGPSMNPTFRVKDLLHLVPYGKDPIRPGDVVVFKHPDEPGTVVHRVVAMHANGLLSTQGDNNKDVDARQLSPTDVIGRVVRVSRCGKTRAVPGGAVGVAIGTAARFQNTARRVLFRLFRPIYRGLAGSRLGTRLSAKLELRVVTFNRSNLGGELHLMMGTRCIGRRLPGQKEWYIKPPFRLFVDEKSLPVGEGPSPESHRP
jgi:signal peptidase I